MLGSGIRLPRAATTLAVGLFALVGCTGNRTTPTALPPPVVEVALPIVKEVTNYQIFTARTQAPQSVQIKARVTGYLTKIDFKDGDVVPENKVLFEIDDRPYKASLDKAKADVEFARASLTKAQAFYDIGLEVRKQNPVAVSQQELDRRLGARDEAAAQVKQALAAQETAQLNFDWCKVTAPIAGRIDRHLVDVGTLIAENMTVLTNIVSINPMWVYFNVDQNSALTYLRFVEEGKVKSARDNDIPVEMGLSLDKSFPFHGKIDFVANQVDPNTGSIQLRATFDNSKGEIASGLFARIRVPSSAPHEALLVADRAIGTDQGQEFLLVVNDKNEVEYRAVDTGQIFGKLREVKRTRTIVEPGPKGADVSRQVEVLKPTDRIVVNGLQRIRPGDKVEVKLVDMATLLTVAPAKK